MQKIRSANYWKSVGLLFSGGFVMHGADGAKAFSGLLGRKVALGFGEHFIADHEFFHRCRAEKRRVEMRVELPMIV